MQEAPSSLTKGGEKASDGKMNSRESHCYGSCEGYCVFNHLPNPRRGVVSPARNKEQPNKEEEAMKLRYQSRIQLKWKSLQKAESEDASTVLWGVVSLDRMSIDKGTLWRKFT